MSNTVRRILLFAFSLPLLFLFTFITFLNHLPLAIAVTGFSMLGALELRNLLSKDRPLFGKTLALALGAFFPILTYLSEFMWLWVPQEFFRPIWVIALSLILLRAAFSPKTDFSLILPRIMGSLLMLFYPAFFLSYLIRVASLPNPQIILALIVALALFNDSMAWLFGVLWGRRSTNIIPTSPQKSLVGFLGGLLGSLSVALFFKMLYPAAIPFSLPLTALWGVIVGFLPILGDLVESGIKRSSGVQDSGTLMPGRGGVLDSVDSMVFLAPSLYYTFAVYDILSFAY